MHLTVGIFGDQELAARLGKKGTSNDISIYNHGSSEGVFTYVCPNSEKIQPLLQTLNMIDLPVIVANNLTKEIGEVMIAVDEMNFDTGFIISDVRDSIQPLIKSTSLEKFEFIGESELRPELLQLKIDRDDDSLMVPIDNYFNVKGVGTVVLGIVKSGKIKIHEKVLVEPLGREVVVKGIQSQDKNLEETEAGMRVGLNLKGIEAEEIRRGFIICRNSEKSSDLKISFTKNKFYKQELNPGMSVMLSVGLQTIACNVESVGNELILKSSQAIAYRKNQHCIVASQNDVLPRIIGSGTVLNL